MEEITETAPTDLTERLRGRLLSEKEIFVISVSGYLDATTAAALDQAILSVTNRRRYNIIVDLSDAEYIASMGWSIFLNHIKKLRDHQGDLKLANMNDGVYEVYKVLEFSLFLKAYSSLEQAALAFDQEIEPLP